MNRPILAASAAALIAVSMGAVAAQAADAPAATAAAPVAPPTLAPHGDLSDTLKASGQFTILSKALDATGLTPVLKRPGPMTLIAPTDAAFQALPPDQLANLMKPENAQQLQTLLTYHVINAGVPLAKIEGAKANVATASGAKVAMDGSGATIMVNDANVTATSATSNGTIYVVDKVLSPSAATASISARPAG